MISVATMVGALGAACLWPTHQQPVRDPAVLVSPQAPIDTTVPITADTYLRQGEPNQNFGTASILRVRPTGDHRALLRVDAVTLAATIGDATVVAARLELTITLNANNWGPSGREIALHRLTVPWTETGATWHCGVDSVPGNSQAECAAGTAWAMGPAGPTPWALPPSATTTIVNGQSGVVSFDVTADIAAWRAGTLSAGWLVKRVDEGPSGAVEFGSRESEAAPRLVLALVGTPLDTIPPPIPDGFIAPDSAVALLVSPPGDDSVLILRNFVEIVFHDTTSGPTVLDVFARYGAQVAGGYPRLRGYIVQVPDPGPTYTALDSLLALLRSEPAIRNALQYVFSEPYRNPGRYPDDDSQLRGMRAPLARGCERGLYGPDTVVVCVVDTAADTGRPAVPNGFAPPDSSQALFFALPGDTRVLILRDFIHLEFDDSTAGTRVHSILQEYSAEVAGGFPSTGTYVVRIPDPGPSYSSLESIMAAIRLESGVRGVYRYVYQEPIRNPARFPQDGGAAHRSDRPSSTGALAHRARGGARPAVLVRPQAPFERAAPLTADTYLRQGAPNQNFGAEPILRVRPTGDNRALLRVLSSSGTDGTPALRVIRAPLAWGCETGAPRAQEGRHATLGLDGSFGAGEPEGGGES